MTSEPYEKLNSKQTIIIIYYEKHISNMLHIIVFVYPKKKIKNDVDNIKFMTVYL